MYSKPELAEKARELLVFVEAICRGEKPHGYPPELFKLIYNMAHDGFLGETPESYVTLQHEDPNDLELRKHKGVTSVHPISAKLQERRGRLDTDAHAAKIYNYKVLGLDPYFRLNFMHDWTEYPDAVELAEDARTLILTRGDMHSLRQALQVIIAKAEDDIRVKDTTLIIQNSGTSQANSEPFWSPLLSYLGLKAPHTKALESIGIYVTLFRGNAINNSEAKESTFHVLKTLDAGTMALAPKADRINALIKINDLIAVASGSGHKPIETKGSFDEMRARIRAESLGSLITHKPREAEEDNCSYEGNNLQKMRETHHVIHTLGYDEVCKMLCPEGKGPEDVWIIFDDRGFDFMDHRIVKTNAFAAAKPQFNPYENKHHPGAELASLLKTHSRKEIFEQMLKGAIEEIEAEGGAPVDTTVLDCACHIAVRLDWFKEKDPNKIKYIATMATRRSGALTHPQPDVKVTQTDHYLYPLTYNEGVAPEDIETKAQIDKYVETQSEVAGSLRTLGALTGIAEHSKAVSGFKRSFQAAVGRPPQDRYKIATIHTLFPSINGHGPQHLHKAMNGTFKLMSGHNKRYNLEPFINPRVNRFNKSPRRANDEHRDQVEKALTTLRRLYEDADGFILGNDSPDLKRIPGLKFLKTLFATSLTVGKQVDDRAIKAKFFGIIGDDWKESFENMFHHMSQTAALLNRWQDITSNYKGKLQLKDAMQTFVEGYIRPHTHNKPVEHKADGKKMPSDLFRVTIYCSASLGKDMQATKDAKRFTFGLAQNGFGIINGGGREGLMFATSEGVHDFRTWWSKHHKGQPAPRNHVTSYQCHDTKEREGGWHPKNEDAIVFKHIEQRMANLMNTDAEVLLAGGAGSVQEIAASLLMREWGMMPTKNRPLIIVNELLNNVPVYEPLIQMLSASERKRMNIHVVNTIEEAEAVLIASREALAQDLGPGQIYIPTPENQPIPALDRKLKVA